MGLSSRFLVHARHRDGPRGRDDPRNPRRQSSGRGHAALRSGLTGLRACTLALLLALPAAADPLRIATYNADLSYPGPGLLLLALRKGQDPKIDAVVAVLHRLNADVVLLTGIDFDLRAEALGALADRLATAGTPYPYRMALRPNTGVATGLDLDGNGHLGEPRDAQGYGRFAGEGGMAILSRLPIDSEAAHDFNAFLWADLPGSLTPDRDPALRQTQRLSTTGHWDVPVILPDGRALHLLAYYASPPVFDGPEDRNGRRNHDETAFWLRLLEGALPFAPPKPPFVILGQTSLDPADGEGRAAALTALLAHPALQDPAPRAPAGRTDPGQAGDPALDTALYPQLGGLRVEVILPSAEIAVATSGILWPPESDPFAATVAAASRHRALWVDLTP